MARGPWYETMDRGQCFYDTACNRHNNKTVTLRKHVSKYKNKRKWFVEFFIKFENRSIN